MNTFSWLAGVKINGPHTYTVHGFLFHIFKYAD